VTRNLRIDHLPGDDFGRVSLVMDGRRVLGNFDPEDVGAIVEILRRREGRKGSAAAGRPDAP
jgi:hypothetical protein